MSKSRSSGVLTSDTQVATGRNYITAVIAGADGTNAATVALHDGTSASAPKILSIVVKAGETLEVVAPCNSITVDSGIFVDVTGTGANATVLFGA